MPPAPDPLASPTLAQLYLGQGKLERAQQVLERLLEDDPYAGAALALHRRLSARNLGEIALKGGVDGVRLRFELGDGPVGVHAVLTTFELVERGVTRQRVTSRPIDGRSGEFVFDAPRGPASASACLAQLVDGRVAVLAVAATHSW